MALAQRKRFQLRKQQALAVSRAHEEERAWVASELHDDILQRIALVRAELETLWASTEPRSTDVLEARLRGVNAELVDLAVSVRRIAARLHPTVVDQVGIVPALEALASEVERGSTIDVHLVAEGKAESLAPETARAAYRIVQESLRNAVRHSGGRNATVSLIFGPRELTLRVVDDGKGFDTSRSPGEGLGIASLRERALLVGGRVTILSRPGVGTSVDVLLPLGTT